MGRASGIVMGIFWDLSVASGGDHRTRARRRMVPNPTEIRPGGEHEDAKSELYPQRSKCHG
jgi:hypothetical protein